MPVRARPCNKTRRVMQGAGHTEFAESTGVITVTVWAVLQAQMTSSTPINRATVHDVADAVKSEAQMAPACVGSHRSNHTLEPPSFPTRTMMRTTHSALWLTVNGWPHVSKDGLPQCPVSRVALHLQPLMHTMSATTPRVFHVSGGYSSAKDAAGVANELLCGTCMRRL